MKNVQRNQKIKTNSPNRLQALENKVIVNSSNFLTSEIAEDKTQYKLEMKDTDSIGIADNFTTNNLLQETTCSTETDLNETGFVHNLSIIIEEPELDCSISHKSVECNAENDCQAESETYRNDFRKFPFP